MSFLARWFEHPTASAPVAKQRLKLVLAQERLRVSPDTQSVSISFRGTREGLCITLGDGAWEDLTHELAAQLEHRAAESGFRGAKVHLETGDRSVSPPELEEVSKLLGRYEMTLSSVIGQVTGAKAAPGLTPRHTAAPAPARPAAPVAPPPVPPPPEALGPDTRLADKPTAQPAPAPSPKPTRPARAGSTTIKYATKPVPAGELPDLKPIFAKGPAAARAAVGAPAISAGAAKHDQENPLQASQALLIRRTVRSGQVIHYAGTIVVFGDVNPAAEVIAEGDVIVLGKLRGVVHAGSAGDDNAVVGALILAPTQVRIGRQVARAPDEKRWHPWPAEIARIRSGQIVVEPWGVP